MGAANLNAVHMGSVTHCVTAMAAVFGHLSSVTQDEWCAYLSIKKTAVHIPLMWGKEGDHPRLHKWSALKTRAGVGGDLKIITCLVLS